MSVPSDESAGASLSSWFTEDAALVSELRLANERKAMTPIVPGYSIVAELGRGGQGAVFLARQEGTRRAVAVKVLTDHSLASPTARRRFEREVSVVAGLDDPGIVRVFDGGVTAEGVPYLVMEHVDGVALDRFVEVAGRDAKATAALVAAVCDALHAAHVKGVIHRDVKPRNVLVDAHGRPRLVDFGLARSTTMGEAGHARGATELSVRGQFLGSLPWASPEQAAGEPGRIDVRSDVYSVGVLLFQALTGGFPYPVDGSLSDTLHAISTQAPKRPSSVRRDLPRDIDAIVLTALAKAPSERYQSAAEMAADLRAFLSGQPIRARSDGAIALTRKALARYRRVALVATGVSVVLLGATLFAVYQARVASVQRLKAQHRFEQVRGIANDLLFRLHDDLVKLPGSRAARERVVNSALAYLRDLAPDAGDDDAFTAELAEAWEKVGDIQGNPLFPNLGQLPEAIASYREAHALRVRLAERAPRDSLARAEAQAQVGHSLNLIGYAQQFGGDPEAAIATLESAVPSFQAARAAAPETNVGIAEWVSNRDRLGDSLMLLRRPNEALVVLREAEAIAASRPREDPDTSRTLSNGAVLHGKIAYALMALDRPSEALVDSRESVRLIRESIRIDPSDTRKRRSLAVELNDLGSIESTVGDIDAARASFAESLNIAREILAADVSDATAQSDVSYSLIKLGQLLAAEGDGEEGMKHLREARDIRVALSARDPKNPSARRAEMTAYAFIGAAEEARAERASSDRALRNARLAAARDAYQRTADIGDAMKADGVLFDVDAGLADEYRSYVAKIDAKLREP